VNVLVLHTQVPFTRGGAEVLVEGLTDAIAARGHEVDRVALPLSWNPVDQLLTSALAWSLLDLSSFNGRPVDRVICTKYPTWAVQHPRKSLWLIHQHRQAYDLLGTRLSDFNPDDESRRVRQALVEIDRRGLSSCDRRFAISSNVSGRLKRYNGIDAAPLHPPVPRTGLRAESYEPFVLSVSRIDEAKRVHRIVEAWQDVTPELKLVIAGDGPGRDELSSIIRRRGLDGRVELLGRVADEEVVDLYNRCRAVFYAPVDEDYGYAAVEALAAAKPVITAPDSGGVLEFVVDRETGLVIDLEQNSLARAVNCFADEAFARELGADGPRLTRGLTWDRVVSALLGE
jgi:glycosyltransferase involved in cell wall biosynthesis